MIRRAEKYELFPQIILWPILQIAKTSIVFWLMSFQNQFPKVYLAMFQQRYEIFFTKSIKKLVIDP